MYRDLDRRFCEVFSWDLGMYFRAYDFVIFSNRCKISIKFIQESFL